MSESSSPFTVGLDSEIGLARRKISTDSYPMSIGELTNLYRDGELLIQPAFQRLFRWDDEQKSRLIESILLGIPLPSIFVSQIDNGKWELIDGLQRVSTILQFQGLLPGADPLTLLPTKYLQSLEGKSWDGNDPLSEAQRLDFKRSKLDVKIVKRESDSATKYDLFQRLNSYGSPLTAQEMRHALLVGINPNFAEWVEKLTDDANFQECVALPEKAGMEKYDEELVLRFVYLHNKVDVSSAALRSFNQKMDDASVEMAIDFEEPSAQISATFASTFLAINEAAGIDAFRKWNGTKEKFEGGFLNTAFEVIALGIGYHIANGQDFRRDVASAAVELWSRSDMIARFATGVSTERRLSKTVQIGRELMAV